MLNFRLDKLEEEDKLEDKLEDYLYMLNFRDKYRKIVLPHCRHVILLPTF